MLNYSACILVCLVISTVAQPMEWSSQRQWRAASHSHVQSHASSSSSSNVPFSYFSSNIKPPSLQARAIASPSHPTGYESLASPMTKPFSSYSDQYSHPSTTRIPDHQIYQLFGDHGSHRPIVPFLPSSQQEPLGTTPSFQRFDADLRPSHVSSTGHSKQDTTTKEGSSVRSNPYLEYEIKLAECSVSIRSPFDRFQHLWTTRVPKPELYDPEDLADIVVRIDAIVGERHIVPTSVDRIVKPAIRKPEDWQAFQRRLRLVEQKYNGLRGHRGRIQGKVDERLPSSRRLRIIDARNAIAQLTKAELEQQMGWLTTASGQISKENLVGKLFNQYLFPLGSHVATIGFKRLKRELRAFVLTIPTIPEGFSSRGDIVRSLVNYMKRRKSDFRQKKKLVDEFAIFAFAMDEHCRPCGTASWKMEQSVQ